MASVFGGPPSPALLALRDEAADSFQALLRAPAVGRLSRLLPSLPAALAGGPTQAGAPRPKRQRREGGTTWQARPQVDLPALDMERRMRAAKRAGLLLVELAQFSAHREELDNVARLRQTEQWSHCFAKSLALRFDDKSVNHALACWRRWLRWRETQSIRLSPSAAAPLALEITCFLDEVGARGPTAARGVLSGLRFLQDHLGLHQLPLGSPLLAGYRAAPHNHLERPMAKEVSLRVWLFLLSVAGEGAGAVSLFAGLVAFLLVATLRFKHAQRFEFVPGQCTLRTLVGRVYRGKVRGGRPFYVAVPACVQPRRPLFHILMGELQKHAPRAQFLIPDIQIARGQGINTESVVLTKPMSYTKFSACLRFLLTCPPLSLTVEQAQGVSTYSLRRKLPAAADRLALPMPERSALGDWADVVVAGEVQKQRGCREPMAVRYSDARLESSAQVRRIILAAFHDAGSRGWLESEDLRRLAPLVPEYREQVERDEWGLAGAATSAPNGPGLSPVAERPAQAAPDAADEPSSGSSSGSDSGSDEDAEEAVDPAEVFWLLPRGAKSYLHAASDMVDDDGLPIPWCRRWSGRAFAGGFEEGRGVDKAMASGRFWCVRCRRGLLARGVQEDVLPQAA